MSLFTYDARKSMLELARTFYGESLIEQCKILLDLLGPDRALYNIIDGGATAWTDQDITDFFDTTSMRPSTRSVPTHYEMFVTTPSKTTVIERHLYPPNNMFFSKRQAEVLWYDILGSENLDNKLLPTIRMLRKVDMTVGGEHVFQWSGERFCYKRRRWITDEGVTVYPVLSPMSVSGVDTSTDTVRSTSRTVLTRSERLDIAEAMLRGDDEESVSSASTESASEPDLLVPVPVEEVVRWIEDGAYDEDDLSRIKTKAAIRIEEIQEENSKPECPVCLTRIDGGITIMPCGHTYCSLHGTQIALRGKCALRCTRWSHTDVTRILHLPLGGTKRDVKDKITESFGSLISEVDMEV